jgi:glycosyltransferase involved in cell wall biosynthesis
LRRRVARFGLYLADLLRSRTDSQGTVNYAVSLARALSQVIEGPDRLIVLVNAELLPELEDLLDGTTVVAEILPAPTSMPRRLLFDHLVSVVLARRLRLDSLHFPKGFIPSVRPSMPIISTIHDDIAYQLTTNSLGIPDRSAKRRYFARELQRSLRKSDRILTVSDFSARQLAKLVPTARSKIRVTYEGLPQSFLDTPILLDKKPRLIHFSSSLPHKRTNSLLRWVQPYIEESGNELILVGPLPAETESSAAFTHIPGPLSGEEIASMVAEASVLLFPSVYEGFGLPPLEAMAVGTPATWSRCCAMNETLADFPGGHAPDSESGFRTALEAVLLLSPDERHQHASAVRSRTEWTPVAEATLAAYRDAAALGR